MIYVCLNATQMIIPAGNNSSDENNLLYVAVTRAKKCLIMSPKLLLVLKACGV